MLILDLFKFLKSDLRFLRYSTACTLPYHTILYCAVLYCTTPKIGPSQPAQLDLAGLELSNLVSKEHWVFQQAGSKQLSRWRYPLTLTSFHSQGNLFILGFILKYLCIDIRKGCIDLESILSNWLLPYTLTYDTVIFNFFC